MNVLRLLVALWWLAVGTALHRRGTSAWVRFVGRNLPYESVSDDGLDNGEVSHAPSDPCCCFSSIVERWPKSEECITSRDASR